MHLLVGDVNAVWYSFELCFFVALVHELTDANGGDAWTACHLKMLISKNIKGVRLQSGLKIYTWCVANSF